MEKIMPKKKLFQEIYDKLSAGIENGLYSYQSMLLSESELCAHYGCSRSSVRRALAELARDGYVQPIQGKGVRVIWRPETDEANDGYSMGGLESFKQTADRMGFQGRNKVLEFKEVVVDAAIAQTTGFIKGDELFFIKRLRYADNVPVSLERSWMLKAEAPKLTKEIATDSLYCYLESTGVRIAVGKRTITVEEATEEDKELLKLTTFPAVGVMRGQHFDDKGIMFEYSEIRQHPYYFSIRESATRPKRSTKSISVSHS